MIKISKFYTYFWILYFPLCIAFYDLVNDYVDEIMTLLLALFTLLQYGCKTNNTLLKELKLCIGIFCFYLVYSLLRQVNVPNAALIDFQQQLRPYLVFYCTFMLAPKFSKKQKKYMLASTLFSWIGYLFYHGSAVWSNENVVFGSLSIAAGMSYYLFTKPSKRNGYIALVIVVIGLLCGKFKYIGECVSFICVILFLKKKIPIGSTRSAIMLILLVSIVLFFVWARFDSYFITGMSNDNLARPMMYKAMPQVLWDYFPLGPGLGTFGTSASAKVYYSQLYYDYHLSGIWGMAADTHGAFNADSYYPSLAQFGVVGIFFFFIFWRRRLLDFNRIEDIQYYKVALMAFLCLAIESFGDTSYLSGRGMCYFMLIAICMNSGHNENSRFIPPNNTRKKVQIKNSSSNIYTKEKVWIIGWKQ